MNPIFNVPEESRSPALGQALERLDRLINWERLDRSQGRRRMRVDLWAMRDLAERLGNPQKGLACVHVAGSKGKGSVAALIGAGVRRMGWSTGVYGSPHVERIHERIVLGEEPIGDVELVRYLTRALDARAEADEEETDAARGTWFDVLTAAALLAFREVAVDLAVIECGLGGRLDSTNVVDPLVCVLTNIELEHTSILGSTRAAIAAEKAGIVKPGVPVVSGVGPPGDEAADVIAAVAKELESPFVPVDLEPGLSIEERNLLLAGVALDELGRRTAGAEARHASGRRSPRDRSRMDRSRMVRSRGHRSRSMGRWLLDDEARAAARLPGRQERFRSAGTVIVADGAHTPKSISLLLRELERDPGLPGKPTVILGMGREKDVDAFLKVLKGRADRVLCTSVGSGPYYSSEDLLEAARRAGLAAEKATSPRTALNNSMAFAAEGGWILITGSLHLVGNLRPYLRSLESHAC